MRVTNQSVFNNLTGSVLDNLSNYNKLQNMISTGDKLTKPSDNPQDIGESTRLNLEESAYSQYQVNLDKAESYLKATDGALDQLNNVLTRAREIAEFHATQTSDGRTRDIGAQEMDELIGRSLEIANTEVNGKYIFSGYNTDTPAYSDSGRILNPYASDANEYSGNITAEGDYKGNSNTTYQVQITKAGGIGTAEYQVSEDGGETWSESRQLKSGFELKDSAGIQTGINLGFDTDNFAEGDKFKVYVESAKYQGDSGNIKMNIHKNSSIDVNLTGQEVFEDNNYFDILHRLKIGMENDDDMVIANSLEELSELQDNLENEVVKAGSQLNKLEIARNNLEVLDENVNSAISKVEDADMVEVMSEFSLQEAALQYSVTALSKIIPNNLLSYI